MNELKMNELMLEMIKYFSGDPKRIQHFIKVHSLARLIASKEGAGERLLKITEAAALVHDIGIKNAEAKYGSCAGKLQEREGPPEAEIMLRKIGADEELTERVKFLVGHHHTYTDIRGLDYQALVEADFLVNLYEDNSGKDAAKKALDFVFATETGKKLCREMFGV